MLLVGFRIGAERYALRGRDVEEVIPRVELRAVPLAARGVVGLFTYRGEVTPVVDLGLLLGDSPVRNVLSSRILVVRIGNPMRRRHLGLLAESVTEVLQESGSLQETLRIGTAPFLGDAFASENSLVQILEPDKILSEELLGQILPGKEPQ